MRIVLFWLILLATFPFAAQGSETFRSITGITEEETSSCKADSDCAIVYSYTDCCRNTAVNIRYKNLIESKHNALFEALTSSKRKRTCALKECAPPKGRVVCSKERCEIELGEENKR